MLSRSNRGQKASPCREERESRSLKRGVSTPRRPNDVPAIYLIGSPRVEWPGPAEWPRWVRGEVRSSAAACRRRTSSPAPSDGDRRPAISVTSPRLPGSGRLSVTSESTFNVLAPLPRDIMQRSVRRNSGYVQEDGNNYVPSWKGRVRRLDVKLIAIGNVSVKTAYAASSELYALNIIIELLGVYGRESPF